MPDIMLSPEVMEAFVDVALDISGDLGHLQHFLEVIATKYCPDYEVPNLWDRSADDDIPEETWR